MEDALQRFFDNKAFGMDKLKYMEMCEFTGEEFDPLKCPPDFSDFPFLVQMSFELYNYLPDLYIAGGMGPPIFNGKDITPLTMLFDTYEVDSKEDRRRVLAYISIIDRQAKKESYARARKASGK